MNTDDRVQYVNTQEQADTKNRWLLQVFSLEKESRFRQEFKGNTGLSVLSIQR